MNTQDNTNESVPEKAKPINLSDPNARREVQRRLAQHEIRADIAPASSPRNLQTFYIGRTRAEPVYDAQEADIVLSIDSPNEDKIKDALLNKILHIGSTLYKKYGVPRELIDFSLKNGETFTVSNYLDSLNAEQLYRFLRALNKLSPILPKLGSYATLSCCHSPEQHVLITQNTMHVLNSEGIFGANHRDGSIGIYPLGLRQEGHQRTFGSLYHKGRSEVDKKGYYECDHLEWNIVHEIGHSFEQDWPEWELTTGWKGTQNNQELPPSDYATTNAKEDFAESFTLYVFKPDVLELLSPSRYAFMHSRFAAIHGQPEVTKTDIKSTKTKLWEKVAQILIMPHTPGEDLYYDKKRKKEAIEHQVVNSTKSRTPPERITYFLKLSS